MPEIGFRGFLAVFATLGHSKYSVIKFFSIFQLKNTKKSVVDVWNDKKKGDNCVTEKHTKNVALFVAREQRKFIDFFLNSSTQRNC